MSLNVRHVAHKPNYLACGQNDSNYYIYLSSCKIDMRRHCLFFAQLIFIHQRYFLNKQFVVVIVADVIQKQLNINIEMIWNDKIDKMGYRVTLVGWVAMPFQGRWWFLSSLDAKIHTCKGAPQTRMGFKFKQSISTQVSKYTWATKKTLLLTIILVG